MIWGGASPHGRHLIPWTVKAVGNVYLVGATSLIKPWGLHSFVNGMDKYVNCLGDATLFPRWIVQRLNVLLQFRLGCLNRFFLMQGLRNGSEHYFFHTWYVAKRPCYVCGGETKAFLPFLCTLIFLPDLPVQGAPVNGRSWKSTISCSSKVLISPSCLYIRCRNKQYIAL